MKTKHQSQIAGFVALASFIGVLACPNSVFALGFALPDQDAFAMARGNAFVATADNPSAVYYNPAGITQLEYGKHISLGFYGIDYGSTYNGAGGHISSETQLEGLPQVFSTWSLPYNFTFGLGTYSPFGLRYVWPASAPFTAQGQMGEIDYLTLNPVLAYQITPQLSVAAGAMLSYSEANFKESLRPPFTPITLNNEFRGRDDAAGFNAGVLWHPWEQHSFGVNYRSAQDMNYNGHASSILTPGNVQAQANVHFPQMVAFGYSFRPTTNWNIEADAKWTDYSDLRTVDVNPQAALGDKLAFNWTPSWIFSLGGTRYLGDGWRLSGGFMYSENSVPDADLNPLVPDSDRYIFSVGVGRMYKKFSWDVAYQLAWGPSRSIGTDNFPPADGSYSFLSHAININLGYHF